jgi:site-specific recombinase XerD
MEPNNTKQKSLVPARAALAKAQSAEMPRYVRIDEVQHALDLLAARPRVRAFVRALWLTGGRCSEVLAIRVAEVDFRARLVKLPTLKQRARSARTIPLPADFLGELAVLVNTERLCAEDRLFAWSRSRAFELVRDALLAAGIDRPRAHPHALRHGHAVHALERGAPLNIVQRALGHASLMTTSIYTQVTGEDVRRFYDGIDW